MNYNTLRRIVPSNTDVDNGFPAVQLVYCPETEVYHVTYFNPDGSMAKSLAFGDAATADIHIKVNAEKFLGGF